MLDQKLSLGKQDAENVVIALLAYYRIHDKTQAGTIFAQINLLVYIALSESEHTLDCLLVPSFMEVYSTIAGLDCSEAAVTLLFLIKEDSHTAEDEDSTAKTNR